MDINLLLTQEFKLKQEHVNNTIELLDDGKTIPFIARYRKELTGSLDDQVLRELADRLTYLRNLQKRKEEVHNAIETAGAMTPELAAAIAGAKVLVEIEDIYRPFKPKRKTRASVAREKGLEPLAALILDQSFEIDPGVESEKFVREGLSAEQALTGAMDIIAEDLSDDADLRKQLRILYNKQGVMSSRPVEKMMDQEGALVYQNYFEFSSPLLKLAPHRILALDRAEKEGFLRVSVEATEAVSIPLVTQRIVKNDSPCGEVVRQAAEDAAKRLIFPSIEREVRSELTASAADQAIKVFSSNLRQLLMQPPVKGQVTLGLDPGYRTGCKYAVVDDTGKVLDTGVAYITHSKARADEAQKILHGLIIKHKVTTIAIGNGTASRETEAFAAQMIRDTPGVSYMVVSEAGASVYSASKLGAEEFPEFDVSLRSAVSIARRLQDPLAELVKIDPKAIGVGQYQHDMPKARLEEALSGVVEDCVNAVGVDLNTASHSLLTHIAGINASVAKKIVAYRETNGSFPDRKTLLKVEKLGKKAFEQCAGFLRVTNGSNPLDNTAVHPESYDAAKRLLESCGYKLSDLSQNMLSDLPGLVQQKNLAELSTEIGIGIPTLQDIVKELQKPGRDPRDELPPPLLRSGDIMELKDLTTGMELVGTVRNIVDFGAFVDIGVHEDGLVHVSQLSDRFIRHPLEAVKVGDVVKVRVLEVDLKRQRISLTMKKA